MPELLKNVYTIIVILPESSQLYRSVAYSNEYWDHYVICDEGYQLFNMGKTHTTAKHNYIILQD